MKNAKICSDLPVTLVGGGALGAGDLEQALDHASVLVAADGGASYALAAGVLPDLVVGDLDSLSREDRTKIPDERVVEILEQDSTDFDKALRSIQSPLVLAIGFLGNRVDHQLAALNVLARYPQKPCVLIGDRELVFHIPPVFSLSLNDGDTVSLFPMAPVQGRSVGLQWPIDGLKFEPGARVGTSNRALGRVQLNMAGPGGLLIVPRSAFDAVMQAFAAIASPHFGQ